MNAKKTSVVLLLLVLFLILSACGASGTTNTTPSTGPTETATNPTEPAETTAPTEPEETEPPTEPEPQTLEPEGTPMTPRQLQKLHWELSQEPGGWYDALLADTFTDPKELNVFRAFGNGVPNPVPGQEEPDLTPEEQEFVNTANGRDVSNRATARIPRETLEWVLVTYLELTPEDVETMDFGEAVHYWEETDCYYIVQNSYGYTVPYFHEGYTMADGTLVIYYCDALSTPWRFHRAVLRAAEGGIYKILEITQADVAYTE